MDNQGSIDDEKDVDSAQDSSTVLSFVGEITESSNSETDTITLLDESTQHPTEQMDQAVMDNLGRLFEHCIQRVSRQEKLRDELIQELLSLHEPMLRIVKHLSDKVVQTQRLLTLAQLDYVAVYEEVQQVKRKLFATARECIQSQVTLAAQEYEVAQSAVTQVGTTGLIVTDLLCWLLLKLKRYLRTYFGCANRLCTILETI